MGQLPNNEIPTNRASQNQRARRVSVPPRVQTVFHGDIAGEIRGIVSRPLAIPNRPHSSFPKVITVMVVLLVAGLVTAKIKNEKPISSVSSTSSSKVKMAIPKVTTSSASYTSVAPRQNLQMQTQRPVTKSKDPKSALQTLHPVSPELMESRPNPEQYFPTESQSQTVSHVDVDDVGVLDQVKSSSQTSSSDTNGISVAYVPSTTPTEKITTPEKELLQVASASSIPDDSCTLKEMASCEVPSVPRQRTLTPEQKRAAGIPYEIRRVDSLAMTSLSRKRTLTPEQKRATGISYEMRPVMTSGENVGASKTHPSITSMRSRTDDRVPLLPPPPGIR